MKVLVSMRYVFLAVCLSLSADMRYLSAAEINLPDLGDSAGSVISPEQERKIAKSFLRELRRQAPLETDEEIVDYLNELVMHSVKMLIMKASLRYA